MKKQFWYQIFNQIFKKVVEYTSGPSCSSAWSMTFTLMHLMNSIFVLLPLFFRMETLMEKPINMAQGLFQWWDDIVEKHGGKDVLKFNYRIKFIEWFLWSFYTVCLACFLKGLKFPNSVKRVGVKYLHNKGVFLRMGGN